MSLFVIDLGKPALFVHVPKTGGTSIRHGRQLSSYRLHDPDHGWSKLPSFAFVRDPFDRAESAWRDFRYVRPQTHMEFDQWLEEVHDPAIAWKVEMPNTMEHHAAPMTHPVHGLRHARFVGQYATLQQDFDSFCREHDLERFELPRLRASGDAPRAPRTRETRRLVERFYAEDYDMLTALKHREVAC